MQKKREMDFFGVGGGFCISMKRLREGQSQREGIVAIQVKTFKAWLMMVWLTVRGLEPLVMIGL